VILERLKIYRRDTEPLVDYYRTRPTFRAVNGAQPAERVASDLAAAIDGVATTGSQPVIVCRSAAELERMHRAGRLVGEVLRALAAKWHRA
jgi:hypothetical protein